jgi:hypothetical protein
MFMGTPRGLTTAAARRWGVEDMRIDKAWPGGVSTFALLAILKVGNLHTINPIFPLQSLIYHVARSDSVLLHGPPRMQR